MVSEEVASPYFLVTSPDFRDVLRVSHRVVNEYSNILTIDFDKN